MPSRQARPANRSKQTVPRRDHQSALMGHCVPQRTTQHHARHREPKTRQPARRGPDRQTRRSPLSAEAARLEARAADIGANGQSKSRPERLPHSGRGPLSATTLLRLPDRKPAAHLSSRLLRTTTSSARILQAETIARHAKRQSAVRKVRRRVMVHLHIHLDVRASCNNGLEQIAPLVLSPNSKRELGPGWTSPFMRRESAHPDVWHRYERGQGSCVRLPRVQTRRPCPLFPAISAAMSGVHASWEATPTLVLDRPQSSREHGTVMALDRGWAGWSGSPRRRG